MTIISRHQRDAAHGTALAWPGWVTVGNLSEGGLAQLIGSGFKKGCVLLYYSSTEFESTLTVEWNRAWELPGCPIQTLRSENFLFKGMLFFLGGGGVE